MYEREEERTANSIKSIIPEAAPCYQQRSKGVLMHCLHAQPTNATAPTTTEIKDVVVGVGGGGHIGDQRALRSLHKKL